MMSFDKNVFLNAFFKSVINEIFNRRFVSLQLQDQFFK